MFIDAEYWNELHPNETPLNPDSTGELSHWKKSYEHLLQTEAERGNYPSVVPIKARRRQLIPLQITESTRRLLPKLLNNN